MAANKDLGYVAWKDPYAWVEPMKGERWSAFVKRENEQFQKAVHTATKSKEEVEAIVAAFIAAEEEAESKSEWILERGDTRLRLVPQGGGAYEMTWLGKVIPQVADVDILTGTGPIYTHVKGATGQKFELVAPHWRQSRVGPSVASLGGRVYFLEESSPLRFDRLVSVNARTGGDRRVLYSETCRLSMLSLIRGGGGCLFLLSDNAGRQALFKVREDGVDRLCEEGVSFIAVGAAGSNAVPEFFYRTEFDGPWIAAGPTLCKWKGIRPLFKGGSIEAAHLSSGLLVLKSHGKRSMWLCRPAAAPKKLHEFYGEVEMHPWRAWWQDAAAAPAEMLLTIPGAMSPVRAVWRMGALEIETHTEEGHLRQGVAKSADGTPVHWIYVSNVAKPHSLMAVVYGAYGTPTRLSTTRWRPYLERGWAIGFTFVRGGGDHTPGWAEAGRREGKARGVDDYVAAVQSMREAGGFSAEQVCAYGRSAGGYIVGTAVARHPGGDLFGTAYMEVPYVDVLHTAANPKLPLTEYEYLEFGNPRERIRDLEHLVRESPVQALGPKGAPGVFVLCRTALDDLQVFAYESAKWILALRGGSAATTAAPKLLAITAGEGHHAHGRRRIVEFTEDFLLLAAATAAPALRDS